MPDISKINAVAIADIAKLDAVTAANIEKVNGLVFSTAPAIAAPAAAYSVRLLDTAVGVPTYTGSAMRVREDGTNTETDIGFDGSGNLDTAAIAAHCGSNNGFVRYWYDQSGNTRDAGQATAGSQPQIYNGTAVITENGKPAIRFFNDLLTFTQIDFAGAMHLSHVLNQSGFYYSLGGYSGGTYTFSVTPAAYRYTLTAAGTYTATTALTNGQQFHTQLQRDASNGIETFADNTAGGGNTSSGTFGFDRIGGRTTGAWRDNQQELILWAADISDDQGDIASNVNTYFSIY